MRQLLVILVLCRVAIAAPSSLARAEAAEHASRWVEAAAAWTEVTTGNPTNGRYWRSLADARSRTDDSHGAIAAYERAIELGDDPAAAAYAIAGRWLVLGDVEAAVAALTRAFKLGYRDLERARADTAFARLHDDARFQALVGVPAKPPTTREAGWRFDLELVAREVHRRAFDPFRRITSAEFDARIHALGASTTKRTDGQMIIELAKLLREIGDGHTGVLGARRPEIAWALPLSFYVFDDGVYIIAADPKLRDLVGAKLERIDGHPVRDVIAALEPMISRDNEMWVKAMAPFRMRSTAILAGLGLAASSERARLSITSATGPRDVDVAADQQHPDIWNSLPYPDGWIGAARPSLESRDNARPYWLERDAAHGVVYVQYNRVVDADQLAAFAARVVASVQPRDKLVIDLRHNNGGDTFANEPFLHALMRIPGLERRGRLFVIIGRRTFSAAENAAAYLERHLHPVFVGEPTGGKPNSVGDEVPFTLPYSSTIVNVSDLYWQSGWPQDHRNWIAPDVYAPPTIDALRTGRDPALEAVIVYTP